MIFKPAYVLICPECEAHGKIVFDDISTSDDFRSREELYELIIKARKEKEIDEYEERHLREVASKLNLKESDPFTKFAAMAQASIMKKIKSDIARKAACRN